MTTSNQPTCDHQRIPVIKDGKCVGYWCPICLPLSKLPSEAEGKRQGHVADGLANLDALGLLEANDRE